MEEDVAVDATKEKQLNNQGKNDWFVCLDTPTYINVGMMIL